MAFFSTWRAGLTRRPRRRPRADGRRLTVDILEDRTLPSVCVVDRLTDVGQGQGLAGDLRYCLTRAADGDAITFDVAGTINLTRALPDLTHSIAIEGPGADRLTVRRNTGGAYRIFTLTGAEAVDISGLTLANGRAVDGGGIYVDGATLTLAESALTGNSAVGNDGRFSGNTAGTGRGGGLYVARGTVELHDSVLSANVATGGTGASATINSSVYSGGHGGTGLGGGIYVGGGTVDLSSATLSQNSAQGGDGGNGGLFYTDQGYILYGDGGNGGAASGGGIYLAGGMLTIQGSTLTGNRASAGYGGAGLYSSSHGGRGGRGGDGFGGALSVASGGTAVVEQSTLAGSQATGGSGGSGYDGGRGGDGFGGAINVASGGSAVVEQSTLTASQATGGHGGDHPYRFAGLGGDGIGGGIYISGQVEILHSTVAQNRATGGASGIGFGSYAGQGIGGGLYNRAQMRGTILAGNTVAGPGSNSGPDLDGSLGSLGYNLIGNTQGRSGFDPTDLLDVDPLLGPLADNGGPTPTMALLPGSPALNTGDPDALGSPDQRGVVRSGGVNIGAYQASATAFLLSAPDAVDPGVPFDVTVTAVDPFGQVAVGYTGTVTFRTSDPDPGVVLPADYTFTLDDGGNHTFSDTGLGETTLLTPGDQTLTVTDTADDGLTGSALLTVGSPAPGAGRHGRARPPRPGQSEETAPPARALPRPEVVADRWFASAAKGDSGLTLPPLRHVRVGADGRACDPWRGDELLLP